MWENVFLVSSVKSLDHSLTKYYGMQLKTDWLHYIWPQLCLLIFCMKSCTTIWWYSILFFFILCHPNMACQLVDYCDELIKYFLRECLKLFGPTFFVYNVHLLCHITSDVRWYGNMDKFSCFQFETFLGFVRKCVHSSRLPLQQVVNRVWEYFLVKLKHQSGFTFLSVNHIVLFF